MASTQDPAAGRDRDRDQNPPESGYEPETEWEAILEKLRRHRADIERLQEFASGDDLATDYRIRTGLTVVDGRLDELLVDITHFVEANGDVNPESGSGFRGGVPGCGGGAAAPPE